MPAKMSLSHTPRVVFKVGKRREGERVRQWLERRALSFERGWDREGAAILRGMRRLCGFGFPSEVEELVVYLHRRRKGDARGEMDEADPYKANLYLRRSDTWATMKNVLVHEVVHCLLWARYYNDARRREASFFEDLFADELLTSLIDQMVLRRRVSSKEALDYALSCLEERLSRLRKERGYKALLGSWREYVKGYRARIRRSDALVERREILGRLKSPLPPKAGSP